jgi:hypothetical protein
VKKSSNGSFLCYPPRRQFQIYHGVLCAITLLLAACASTSLTNSWRDPAYTGPALKKIMVMGVSTQPSVRRVFEDEFVAELKVAGVGAVASYKLIPQDGKADEATLQRAVHEAGADGALITRLVRIEMKTQVTSGFYQSGPAMGFYGWYSSAWVGYYEPPMVYQYDVVTAETSLYDINAQRLLWSGTTETFAPTNVKKETKEFATVIIDALKQQRLI